MAVVVSDTTPLHYLILIGQDSVLEKLYGKSSCHLRCYRNSPIRLRPR